MMNSESRGYQEQLISNMRARNPTLSEQILHAFRAIPRHLFVDHYYLHEGGGGRIWTKQERNESAAWYEHVYGDDALVTRVDQYGRTLSSSSPPGVMACMLHVRYAYEKSENAFRERRESGEPVPQFVATLKEALSTVPVLVRNWKQLPDLPPDRRHQERRYRLPYMLD